MRRLVIVLLILFCLCAVSAVAKEKSPYEKFSYSLPVEANWTNTLTYIDVGDLVKFEGSGSVRPTKESPLIGPTGLGDDSAGAGYNCPELPAHSLIAKIGKYGDCFMVGEKNQATPREPGFLFFAVNSRDDIRAEIGGAGKFDIIVEILRPTCGDGLCEEGEIGYCADDCDWCGDGECNANETCSACSKDCGFCAGDIEAIEARAKEYFDLLQNNDFTGLVDISSGKFQEYYDEFKRFEREFQKSIDMLGIAKENELLPKFEFTDVDVNIDEMRDNDAIVNASVDDKLYQFKLGKEDGEWKLKDMRDIDEDKWFTSDLNLKSLRDNHNDYLGRITEDEGMTPQDIKIDATTTKSPMKLVIITVVIILIFFGAIYFIFAVIKKRKIFNFSALKKIKFSKGSKKKRKDKEDKEDKEEKKDKEEKEETNVIKKEKKSRKEEKLDLNIGGESKCPKCNAEVFAHERFCVKCGTKLKKKR